uniref:Uncharacterized protein n=1 Tax=Mola mola TaxID=94237 RepID=A0A3Q3W7C5_MOLML
PWLKRDRGDSYIRPNHQHKFQPATVKNCSDKILTEHLSESCYDPEEVHELNFSCIVLAQCSPIIAHFSFSTDVVFNIYKLVVQVVIGEQRRQAVKISSRCLWDTDTDNYVEDVFMNIFWNVFLLGNKGWI